MRNLVRRYVTQEQRKAENEGVTEDDVNEIKNDISAFRFEMIEIMRASGMNTQSATGPSGKLNFQNEIFNILQHPSYYFLLLKYLNVGPGGKKNRQKERRLMKGYNVSNNTNSNNNAENKSNHITVIEPPNNTANSDSKLNVDSKKKGGDRFSELIKILNSVSSCAKQLFTFVR